MNAQARREAVREVTANGGTIDQAVEAGEFPGKDALWVFCKRNNLRDEYAAMRDRTPIDNPGRFKPGHGVEVIPWEPMRPAGRRVRLPNGITVWRQSVAA